MAGVSCNRIQSISRKWCCIVVLIDLSISFHLPKFHGRSENICLYHPIFDLGPTRTRNGYGRAPRTKHCPNIWGYSTFVFSSLLGVRENNTSRLISLSGFMFSFCGYTFRSFYFLDDNFLWIWFPAVYRYCTRPNGCNYWTVDTERLATFIMFPVIDGLGKYRAVANNRVTGTSRTLPAQVWGPFTYNDNGRVVIINHP